MNISDIIEPEIKNDQFYNVIWQIASQVPGQHFLEIGSSSGAGSTEAWVKGILQNPTKPLLHCIEVSQPRFEVLQKTYSYCSQVKCNWGSSVSLSRFPSRQVVTEFYNNNQSNLRQYPLELVLSWLEQDIEYIRSAAAPTNGIQQIKLENNLNVFDAVLIDGSEFLGEAEFAEIYGARFILMDDIATFKCYNPYIWLSGDPSYSLIAKDLGLRNGFAVFQKTT